jgi:hypothetical protein
MRIQPLLLMTTRLPATRKCQSIAVHLIPTSYPLALTVGAVIYDKQNVQLASARKTATVSFPVKLPCHVRSSVFRRKTDLAMAVLGGVRHHSTGVMFVSLAMSKTVYCLTPVVMPCCYSPLHGEFAEKGKE